ncbi:MAG: S1 RNA-binding domain-containing protein [Ruminococcaceae bacterium]|nr:S1 RNA-binding domain-containing protein [Oscillospiraceae bacterium]
MELAVGVILEGKVSSIKPFGAFVSLPEGKSGLVHISEIAHTYVSDVAQHLEVGQTVSVKVIGIDESKRINLSIKQTVAPPQSQQSRPAQAPRPRFVQPKEMVHAPLSDSFEDKLKQFMQESESRMSDLKSHMEKRHGSRRRG